MWFVAVVMVLCEVLIFLSARYLIQDWNLYLFFGSLLGAIVGYLIARVANES